jgi:hypothetical protein
MADSTITRISQGMIAMSGPEPSKPRPSENSIESADTYIPSAAFCSTSSPITVTAVRLATQVSSDPEALPPQWISPWVEALQAVRNNHDIGKAFTPELRKEVEKALTDMHRHGVRFSRDKDSIFASSTRIELSPRDVMTHIANCRDHYLDNLYIQAPGQAELRPDGLHQLAAAHQFILGPPDALKTSLKGLAVAGFDKDCLKSYCEALGSGNLSIQFYRGGQKKFNSDNLETYVTASVDEVLAVNAIAGNGSSLGIEDGDRLRRICTAMKQDWIKKDKALHVYRDHKKPMPLDVDEKLPAMIVTEADLDNVPVVAKAAQDYKDAYKRYMLPVITPLGFSSSCQFHQEVHSLEGTLPLEARIESFAILAKAGGPYQEVQDLHRDLIAACPSGIEAVKRATVLASHLQKKDIAGARKTLEGLSNLNRNPKSELYEELRAATGSHVAAQAGVNMVRIPTHCTPSGAESLEERKGVYIRISQALPESARDQTPEVYQELLINRHTDEPLSKACDRFCTLLTACAATGCPMLAPALYEIVQENPAEGLDEKIARFGKAIAIGSPLPDALSQLEPKVAQSIQVEDDYVIVGGIVLNRNHES